MKHFASLLLVVLLFSAGTFAQAPPPSATGVLKEATTLAAKEHKKAFIIFHASWCGWCHRMDTLMNKPAVKKYFTDNYVIRHITVLESKGKENLENPGGKELMEQYNGKDQGIPFWLVFDEKGTLVGDCLIRPDGQGFDKPGKNTGCPAEKEEVAHFIKVLKQTSKLTADQLAVIEKTFSQK